MSDRFELIKNKDGDFILKSEGYCLFCETKLAAYCVLTGDVIESCDGCGAIRQKEHVKALNLGQFNGGLQQMTSRSPILSAILEIPSGFWFKDLTTDSDWTWINKDNLRGE